PLAVGPPHPQPTTSPVAGPWGRPEQTAFWPEIAHPGLRANERLTPSQPPDGHGFGGSARSLIAFQMSCGSAMLVVRNRAYGGGPASRFNQSSSAAPSRSTSPCSASTGERAFCEPVSRFSEPPEAR